MYSKRQPIAIATFGPTENCLGGQKALDKLSREGWALCDCAAAIDGSRCHPRIDVQPLDICFERAENGGNGQGVI
jgi:hypothetical protein